MAKKSAQKANEAQEHAQSAAHNAKEAGSDAKQAALAKLEELQESELRAALQKKAANASSSAEDTASAAKSSAQSGIHQAQDRAQGLKDSAASQVDGLSDAASQQYDNLQGQAKNVKNAASGQLQSAQDKAANAKNTLIGKGYDAHDAAIAGAQNAKDSARAKVQNAKDSALAPVRNLQAQAGQLEHRAEEQIRRTKSWLDTFVGTPYSLRRTYIAYVAAFWSSSLVRMACLSPVLPIFGKHLSETLAPIERDDVSWLYIALTKAIDLAMAVWVYQSEGSKFDAPLLGVLLTMIGRPTLYQFFHHHFLLSTKTMSEVLLTDATAGAAALFVLSSLLPSPATFRPQPVAWFKRHLNFASFQSIGVALGLGALSSALIEFVSDRTFLHQTMKAGLLEHSIPSYFAASRPASAWALAHPLVAIPTLRTNFDPLNMADAITRSLPFTISFLVLALFVIPQLPTRKLATVVFLLTTPAAFFTLWNILPVTAWSSGVAALVMGLRQALVASIMAWVLADLRRPVESKDIATSVQITTSRIVGRELDGSRLIEEESIERKNL